MMGLKGGHEGASLMCRGDGATKSKKMVYVKSALNKERGALNKARRFKVSLSATT